MPERERAAGRSAGRGATRTPADVDGGFDLGLAAEIPIAPGQVLQSILRHRPDGTPEIVERPLTPLLDTTVLTNAPGEPAVAHEVRAEIPSADGIDVLMAFIRWSGVRNLGDALRRHVPGRQATAGSHDDVHQQHRTAGTRRADSARRRGTRLLRHLADPAARQGVDVSSSQRIFDRLHRLLEPHSLSPGHRTGMERAALRGTQPGRRRQDGGGLRELLGQPRFRALRPCRVRRRTAFDAPDAAAPESRSRSCSGRSKNGCSIRSLSPGTRATTATCSWPRRERARP